MDKDRLLEHLTDTDKKFIRFLLNRQEHTFGRCFGIDAGAMDLYRFLGFKFESAKDVIEQVRRIQDAGIIKIDHEPEQAVIWIKLDNQRIPQKVLDSRGDPW